MVIILIIARTCFCARLIVHTFKTCYREHVSTNLPTPHVRYPEIRTSGRSHPQRFCALYFRPSKVQRKSFQRKCDFKASMQNLGVYKYWSIICLYMAQRLALPAGLSNLLVYKQSIYLTAAGPAVVSEA